MIEQRIKSLCDKHNVSLKAACQAADVSYGTLHGQLKNGREIPFSTMDRLAHFFEVPLAYFSEKRSSMSIVSEGGEAQLSERAATAYSAALNSAQMDLMRHGFGIGTEQILDWLASEGGVLTNFDAIRDRVDLFHPIEVTDSMMRPKQVGKNSLISKQLGLENEQHYVDVVGKFDRSLIDRVMQDHKRAEQQPYIVSDQAIEVVFANQRVRHSYRRVLASVRDLQGNRYTLVHAKPI
ncbi:MAG: hypothetical protein AB3N23_11010 [Paracoccaceae bacterium]